MATYYADQTNSAISPDFNLGRMCVHAHQYKEPPPAGDLRSGVLFDTITGTYTGEAPNSPAVGSVIEGVNYGPASDPRIGTYHEASAAEVRNGIPFGPSSSYTGTYTPDLSHPPQPIDFDYADLPPTPEGLTYV